MTDDWTHTTLGKVADFINGYPFKPVDLNGRGLPVIRIKQLLDPSSRPDRSDISVPDRYRLTNGDLIFSWSGTLAARIWDRGPGLLNQHLFRVVERPGVSRKWLSYALEHAVADLNLKTHGSTMKHVTKGVLEAHPVSLPPLVVQRRIVDLMEHLDTHLAHLETERDVVAQLLQADLEQGLSELTERQPLVEVLREVRSGGTPSRSGAAYYGGDIPWLKSGEVDRDWILETAETITEAGLSESSAWLVPAESVVVAMYGETRGKAGFIAGPMATNQAVLALVPDQAMASGRFLLHWMRAHTGILRDTGVGAAQPNLSKGRILSDVSFPAIPVSDQERLAQRYDGLSSTIECLNLEHATLLDLRGRLLHRLLSGEAGVPNCYDILLAVS